MSYVGPEFGLVRSSLISVSGVGIE